MDSFSKDQLLDDVFDFLDGGEEGDAALVLDACILHANLAEKSEDGRQGVYVHLECPRLVYDILRHPNIPIRSQIEYALTSVLGDVLFVQDLKLTASRFDLPSEIQSGLMRILLAASQQTRRGVLSQEADGATSGAAFPTVDERLCFVIMSFSGNPQLKDFYEKAIKPTVQRLGYRCLRVDEEQFNGSIRDRIVANIRAARFIIADLTEARPNCYYEVGIAHALGKEVIHITRDLKDVHFDVGDFNFILYKDIDGLKRELRQRALATVGSAPTATAAQPTTTAAQT